MVSYYILSKTEAPKFLYFDPKYHFRCQDVSFKMKYNSTFAVHTLMNITFIHKPMTQSTVVKVIKYKTSKKSNLNEIVLYFILPHWKSIGEFSWRTINGTKTLFFPIVMKQTFHETTYSRHFLLFKDLFLSWKFGELFCFVQLPFCFSYHSLYSCMAGIIVKTWCY